MSRKSERTRERIVQAANRLFYRQGYNRTSFSDIVKASAVPRGNIYYYFRTKDEILLATLESRSRTIDNMLNEWDRKYPSPKARLKRFVQALVNSRDATALYGCPIGTLNTELGKEQPLLQKGAAAMFERFISYFKQQFTTIGYDTEEAKSLSIELLARAQGVSLLTHVFHDPDILKRSQSNLEKWLDQVTDGS